MKISVKPFDYTYHNSLKAGNHIYGKYILHNIDVHCKFIINDVILQAVYQTGLSFYHNDYNYPNPELELSEEGGADEVLIKINELYESDFNDEEFIGNKVEEINKLCPVINNPDELLQIYITLNNNKPCLSDFLDLNKFTDNDEDYIENENTGTLTLKNK